jgi:8-oxo-dGTP pyrophosphatase MutT (NUDIX family)
MSLDSDSCKILTGAVLILKRDNKILLFKRNIPGKIAYGYFALPGGTVEHHETVKQAACREAAEELGITIIEKDLSIVHMLRLREKYDKETNQTKQILMLYFVISFHWNGEPMNLESHKHSELGWFDIDNLPQNTFALNMLALNDIKRGTFYSEHGWL